MNCKVKILNIWMLLVPVMLLTACGPAAATEASPVSAPTPLSVLVTVVVTATPGQTPMPISTPEPTSTIEPTSTVAPAPLPTATLAPAPPTQMPTATPWVVRQTVEVPVTVVVTATPTPVPTSTPTVTPTPTPTPVPTATAVPPFIQHSSGNGSWLSDGFNFWAERPIEIDIDVKGTGSFSLSAVTPNGCVIQLSTGPAPYTARTLAVPSQPDICDGLNEFGNGTQLTVTAGGSVSWAIDLTQYSQPTPQNAPVIVGAAGQDVFGPVRMGQSEILVVRSEGLTRFRLSIYSIYESDPIVARVIDVPTNAIGTWLIDVPFGIYMLAITTEPGREWTVEVRQP